MDFTITNEIDDFKSGGSKVAESLAPEMAGEEGRPVGGSPGTEGRRSDPEKPMLLPNHLAELGDSGLDAAIIAANRIYSESDPAAVATLVNWGVARAKALGPVLVYPHFDRDGNPLDHATVKPDKPRDRKDKPGKVKYENPYQRPNRLYIPVGSRDAVRNPTAELIITEGCKKALAATQHGFPCVGLPGVWNWVAPREKKGGKKVGPLRLNDDLAAIAWQGRRVPIIYDSDGATNPDVAHAERALADALRRRGAEVRVVRLPPEPDGAKNGLDDFLVRHGPEALRQLVEAESPASTRDETPADPTRFTDSGYTAIRGNTYHCVLARDKETDELIVEKQTKLANFTAKIVGVTTNDDGAEQTREFAVVVEQYQKPAAAVAIPVERFGSLDWVVEKFGPQYVILAGNGRRDHLRCAIQEMSGDDIPSATVYSHTGWREIGGRWCYLHGGGAIGSGIPANGRVEVRLDGAATAFRLPPLTAGESLRSAVRQSLGILDGLVPNAVAYPLLATAYRAALGTPDYSLWLAGPTGSQKSELAALAQQHYGAEMSRNRLPGNWSSTDNALEGLAFTVKDAVLVVDDFAPPASRADADRQHRAAERLIRGQGNHSGRQRMRADGTLRPPKPPRGLILATGEDVPRGHSIAARLGVVEVDRGCVNLPRLSECQRHAAGGEYASATAGFISWLAPRYAGVRAGLDAERIALRDQFVGKYPHARTPDIIANLLIGLRYLLKFAEDVGAIDERRREELWHRGQDAFRSLAEQQGEHQRAADPVARFPEMLSAVLSSGRGHVAGTDGKEPGIPPSPESWGWEGREHRSGLGETNVSYQARGRKVGWVGGEILYLDPDATYAALVELARDQGQTYPVGQQTLYRRLNQFGLLLRTDGARTTYPATLEGVRRRVLHLAVHSLLGKPGQPGRPGHSPATPQKTVPVSCPGFEPGLGKPGRETGTDPHESPGRVPTVPVVPVSDAGEGVGLPDALGTDVSREADEGVFTP